MTITTKLSRFILIFVLLCISFLLHKTNATATAAATASVGRSNPIETFVQTIKNARRHLAAAAVARTTSIFGMYPMDTIKTRIQMEQPNALRLQGMYKGVTGSLIGQVPYGVLTFGSYEMYKTSLLQKFPTIRPIFLYAISAILGDITGSGWLCPSEVIKQQMQAGMYPTTLSAIRGIWKKNGGNISGFYQGYMGGLARDVPFRVAQLTSYEITKNYYLQIKKQRQQKQQQTKANAATKTTTKTTTEDDNNMELSAADAAAVGAIAGSFSAAITTPLDRIKTLLMTDSIGTTKSSVFYCASKIWKEEGIGGFYSGIIPRVAYIAPSVAIFFLAYEQVQQRLK